ncbi:uncharacterized protein LOC107621161 isoform X5 [Arachis ipaensis]|uniref:uncharacterized protein LOC107621161 isoform X5 n=1 Tax=Arachis ipaensis TaxID=130454 RepID=UPI000A2B0A0E|nr:uncharacterized protein LOC107621161 isoform X5 [Arachis ipaensis]
MTKKERRPAKLHIVITNDTSQNTPQDRPQEGTNVTPLQIDPLSRKKQRKIRKSNLKRLEGLILHLLKIMWMRYPCHKLHHRQMSLHQRQST